MEIKTKKQKLINLFSLNGLFPFVPYLISFLLIGIIISFFIGFEVNNVFSLKITKEVKEEINLYKIITFSLICFFLLITFIFLFKEFRYLGFLIFLINFLFLTINLWLFFQLNSLTKNSIFSNIVEHKRLLFISLISFFYFGIYFQVLFLNFYKKYSNSEISIFVFLKIFFIKELINLKYYFLIILFITTPAFIVDYFEIKVISHILIFLILNSLIIQYILFLILISFLFLFFDFFIKKNLNKINIFNTKKNIKNNFFIKFNNDKKIIWTKIIFLISFVIIGILLISILMTKTKWFFKNLDENFNIVNSFKSILKNITLTIIIPMIYILLRFRIKGMFVYVFLFPIKLILFSLIFFLEMVESINLNISLIFILFLLDFLLVEKFLMNFEKKYQMKEIKQSIFKYFIFFDEYKKRTNKLKLLFLLFLIEVFLFFDLKKIRFLGFFSILLIVFPLLSFIQKIFYILAIKVENKVNLKIKKSFFEIKFKSGKEEIIKGLND